MNMRIKNKPFQRDNFQLQLFYSLWTWSVYQEFSISQFIRLVHYLLAWMKPIVGGGGELEFKVIGLVHYLLAWVRPIVRGGRGAGIQGHRSCSLPSSVDEAHCWRGRGVGIQGHRSCSLPSSVDEAIVRGGRGAGIQGHRSCSLPSSVDEAHC